MTFNTNQLREKIKEKVQYISEEIQTLNHRNKIKISEIREILIKTYKQRITIIEYKRNSM